MILIIGHSTAGEVPVYNQAVIYDKGTIAIGGPYDRFTSNLGFSNLQLANSIVSNKAFLSALKNVGTRKCVECEEYHIEISNNGEVYSFHIPAEDITEELAGYIKRIEHILNEAVGDAYIPTFK